MTLYKIKICDRLAFNFPCDSWKEKLSTHLLTTECQTIVLGSSLRDNIKKLLAEIELGRFTSLAQITVAVYSTKQTNLSLTLKASTLFQGQANIFSKRSILRCGWTKCVHTGTFLSRIEQTNVTWQTFCILFINKPRQWNFWFCLHLNKTNWNRNTRTLK